MVLLVTLNRLTTSSMPSTGSDRSVVGCAAAVGNFLNNQQTEIMLQCTAGEHLAEAGRGR